MDAQDKIELIRLYELAESSTATTNFYDRVYKYIKFIKNNEFLSNLLEKDNKEWHIYDLERLDTRPKQTEGGSWSKHFLKEMRHMSSGDGYFLSHYFLTLTIDIYDFYDFYYREGRSYDELDIMMNGRKVKTLINKTKDIFKPKDLFPIDVERYNSLYIDHFNDWRIFLSNFHNLLIRRIERSDVKQVTNFVLNENGNFIYLTKTGTFTVSSKEYKLLRLLWDNRKRIVSNDNIIRSLYGRDESKVMRMRINAVIKNIKKGLGILPKKKDSLPDVIVNHRSIGYMLDL